MAKGAPRECEIISVFSVSTLLPTQGESEQEPSLSTAGIPSSGDASTCEAGTTQLQGTQGSPRT